MRYQNKIAAKIEYGLFLTLLAALGLVGYTSVHPKAVAAPQEAVLEVTVFDVGQGDSIFVETPEGRQMLVDGGPNDSVLGKLGTLMPPTDRDIDLVVLTHPHADHVTGLVGVLNRYRIGKIIYTDVVHPEAYYQSFLKEIKEKSIDAEIVSGPEEFLFGGITVNILYPKQNLSGRHFDDLNVSSIVLKLTDGGKKILLTGDLGEKGEKEVIENGADLRADVLKVGHHGSKTSTSVDFLKAVSPKYAIISAGEKNTYGHPHPSLLGRLRNFGAKIFRTDQNGDVTIKTDGKDLSVVPAKP